MYTHLISLSHDDGHWWSVFDQAGKLIGTINTNGEDDTFRAATAPTHGDALLIGRFPDLVAAANAVYATHLMVNA